jgi:curved DNA-binding protein CbpA
LTDHYKTLNVTFGASETEIKKRFRKLATIHHPDKNGGSKKSEETFKNILNAYETLSDKEKRTIYDIKYKQHFQQPKSKTTNLNNTNSKKEKPQKPPPRNREYQKTEPTKPKVNYSFWIVVALLAILYLYYANKTTTTGNAKADKQLEEQKPENRPQSGEINFNK